MIVIEGVGSSRRSLAPYPSAGVWVQSDWPLAEARGIARDMLPERPDAPEAKRFWDDWQTAERSFLAEDRPWQRADMVVCGTQLLELREDEVLIGTAPPRPT